MSRIGKLPIKLPAGVEARLEGAMMTIKGPKGELKRAVSGSIKVVVENGEILVSIGNEADKKAGAMWGLERSLLNNMVVGVSQGFSKKLEINGVGYKVNVAGSGKVVLNVGFSHPVEVEMPKGVTVVAEGNNAIVLSGFDKQLVGEVAAKIRKIRKPEPYKGKGIKYSDEIIRRKAGKSAGKN